ncbi:restriction endonuclease [Arthrobacter castelli]|uniref:restriction endonuclease n=1 Tax=Arthrobacter castelli TaxID=271431 RepID=UPI000413AAAE|nr:restriction endonuclease [Arthrobacter castelli]
MTEAEASDGIPPWQAFMIPVLQVLSDGRTWARRDLIDAALDVAKITPEQRKVLLGAGDSKAVNRVGWAMSDLFKATAVEKPARATYVMTDVGRGLLKNKPGGISQSDLFEISAYADYERAKRTKASSSAKPPRAADAGELSPLEQIETGVDRIEAEVAESLLSRLRNSSPDFFEEAVVKVLLAMGYGGAEQRGRRIGGTGDGGVDGVIDQDALGLDRIYVQAKRYAAGSNVGVETINAFVGALHGFGAAKGVFITSSAFTASAESYAQSIPTRVILIDGVRLVSLMIKYRVGVQARQSYDVVEIDEDFFE